MIIYIGADHRGFQLKEALKKFIKEGIGYEIVDLGNEQMDENDDYPDFAANVAREVQQDPATRRGILICGSGAGMDITANKFKGIRSVLAINPDQVLMSRKDDDTNVLSLAADFINEELSKKIVSAWLRTPFSGEEKNQRRLDKIEKING